MDNAFEAVTAVVALIGIGLSLTRVLWPFRAADEVGHVGNSWFDHEEDHELAQRPDAGRNDPPIPHRPLRPRG